MDDEAEIERLMTVAWGSVAELVQSTEAHLHKQAVSQKCQSARLKYQIDHAELRELVKGKHCTKVREVIEAIQTGKRPPKPQTYQDDDHESRFEEYYDIISGMEALTSVAKNGLQQLLLAAGHTLQVAGAQLNCICAFVGASVGKFVGVAEAPAAVQLK